MAFCVVLVFCDFGIWVEDGNGFGEYEAVEAFLNTWIEELYFSRAVGLMRLRVSHFHSSYRNTAGLRGSTYQNTTEVCLTQS